MLVSIELLLGFYATVTATEAGLTRQTHKNALLSRLISKRKDAEIFFNKAMSGMKPLAQEAAAYDVFMTVIGKLDQLSSEAKFGTVIAAVTAIKEWLWFGGAVVGNETAYKHLASAEIGVSGAEVAGTTLAEMAGALVANVMDFLQGVLVYCRCEERIASMDRIKKQLVGLYRRIESPEIAGLIKKLAGMAERKIDDEKFEGRFSLFRAFKALTLLAIGIAGITALALGAAFAAPWIIGIAAGLTLAAFFIFLIVRSVRKLDNEQEEKRQESEFRENGAENKFGVLHIISSFLADKEGQGVKQRDFTLLFGALDFTDADVAILKNLVQENKTRDANIETVKKQLARMLELKFLGE